MDSNSGVYLLHFDRPLAHAQHYLGWSPDVMRRWSEHYRARRWERFCSRLLAYTYFYEGSCLTYHARQAGIELELARVWVGGDRHLEVYLKSQHNGRALCPVCKPQGRYGPNTYVWRSGWQRKLPALTLPF